MMENGIKKEERDGKTPTVEVAEVATASAGDAAHVPAADPHTIKEGDSVILDVNGERQTIILKLMEGGTFKVERGSVSMDALIGAKFGSLFGVDMATNSLQPQQRVCETAHEDWERVLEIDRNNAALNDAGTANQALTAEDIAQLKREGKSGDEIIAALTAGSATFQGKTQYSQEKYRRKKARKYVTRISAVRPTGRALAEFYFAKQPLKIGCVRADSLALLLTLGNVAPGSRVLLVDGISGLLTGAAMERVGSHARLVRTFPGHKAPPSDIINLFNFPPEQKRGCLAASLAQLRAMLQEEAAPAEAPPAASEPQQQAAGAGKPDPAEASAELASAVKAEPADASGPGAAQPLVTPLAGGNTAAEPPAEAGNGGPKPGKEGRLQTAEDLEFAAERAAQHAARQAELQRLVAAGFQSCMIAAPGWQPRALLRAVLPLLAPSAAFAIHFGCLQPLAECMAELQAEKSCVGLALGEPWWREYQVLPGRTHPAMATSGTGGYLLSGTKLAPGG